MTILKYSLIALATIAVVNRVPALRNIIRPNP